MQVIQVQSIATLGLPLCCLDIAYGAPIAGVMTLDKHQIDGIGGFQAKTLPTLVFEQLLLDAGYSKIGIAPAQGNRIKAWSAPRTEVTGLRASSL
jgi:hypothetical protein